MGRANDWSISNSTGTTNMGIWDEEADVSSPPLETQSEIKSGLDYRASNVNVEGLPTHRYPIYIDNLNGKNNVPIVQECIHFTAVKQPGISLQKVADNDRALAAYENAQNNIANKDTGDLGEDVSGDFGFFKGTAGSFAHADISQKKNIETGNAAAAQNKSVKGERNLLEKGAAAAKGFGAMVKSQHEILKQPAKNLEHCFLYMPTSVQFSEGVSWGAEGLGATGMAVKSLIKSPGGDIGDIMKNFAGGVVTESAKLLAVAAGAGLGAIGGPGAAVLGAVGVASILEGVGGGLRAAGRFTQNPYEEQLFNGIDFRTFTFDFAFAPSNWPEADEVDNIIQMFRKHSRPSFVGGFLGEGLYSFPNEFNIEFLMNENDAFVEHFHIPSIHNCVCTNVTTNYTPEGFWVALKDGRPLSYTLSLAFTETQKITQNDVNKGY